MKRFAPPSIPAAPAHLPPIWLLFGLLWTMVLPGRSDDRLMGIWALDEGFQTIELTFRSDGRYQMDTRSTDPLFDFSWTERGRYRTEPASASLELWPYEYFGEPSGRSYEFALEGEALTLIRAEFDIRQTYRFRPGSRAEVLARESVLPDPVGRWRRTIPNAGVDEYTFRPGGYYHLVRRHEGDAFPPEWIRGRYERDGTRLRLRPYSGIEVERELDFFGNTLTLIRNEPLSGEALSFEAVPGSGAEVRDEAAAAEAFLARAGWQVGRWEVRDPFLLVDLTFRPDGHYIAVHSTEFLRGIVRGRYVLEGRRIRLLPFVGQDPHARSNGEFGKVEATRELDFHDGQLQFIDLGALSQSVVLARKRPASEAEVIETSRLAREQRAHEDWAVGTWEVRDALGWMQFTFRPDGRYLAQSGTDGVPGQVERGRYRIGPDKLTLAPYAGLGAARGFELDLYDGDLFLAGDLARLVVARKLPGSAAEVTARTRAPVALEGERGTILGRWTARLPGQSAALVFRDDGQFRLDRCGQQVLSRDYGLYRVDMAARTLVVDSRLAPVQTRSLDFYGDTLTIHGGLEPPSTYVVGRGTVDADLAASFAADQAREEIDAAWLARVPVGPRDPRGATPPTGNLPPDPNPERVFPDATVLSSYRLYRRLIPGFVHFNVQGTIRSVAIVNTREWHFFPHGRVLVRFKNHYAGPFYPTTLAEVSDTWGAYRVGPQPGERDILHLYADNTLEIETDAGEGAAMTLEDGRRQLFWEKDPLLLGEWASEQRPEPCSSPAGADPGLMNTGVALTTRLAPDEIPEADPVLLGIARSSSGELELHGTTGEAGWVVIDRARSLSEPVAWVPWRTNPVPAGPFTVTLPRDTDSFGILRLRRP